MHTRLRVALAWLPALLLAAGLAALCLLPSRLLTPVQPVPVQLTAGQQATVQFDGAGDAASLSAKSSAPEVAQLEPIMVENGRLTCRLTAYHAGTTIVRCAVGRSSSAAYAVSVVEPEPEPLTDGDFVASVSGEKYHRKDCTFAGRIAAENRVYFLSAADAQAAGYAPCSRCLGS